MKRDGSGIIGSQIQNLRQSLQSLCSSELPKRVKLSRFQFKLIMWLVENLVKNYMLKVEGAGELVSISEKTVETVVKGYQLNPQSLE